MEFDNMEFGFTEEEREEWNQSISASEALPPSPPPANLNDPGAADEQ